MIKRSAEEWRTLFAQQAASGLSAAQFCKEQGLCNKHFSVRKKQLGVADKDPVMGFVRAVRVRASKPKVSVKQDSGLVIRCGQCLLQFESMPSPEWLASLMGRLA